MRVSRPCCSFPVSPLASKPLEFTLILCISLAICGGRGFAQVRDHLPSDVERLDAYLERLGTANLRIRNLERELERPHPLGGISAIAARLAQVYAERLLTVTDPGELADLSARLNRLLVARPGSGGTRVRLTLLEGEYNRAELLALKWVGNPSEKAARADALSRLGKCRPQLDQARDELLSAVKRLDDQADHLDAGLRRDAVEAELRTVSQSANRAVYFASWANFYERLLSPATSGEGFRVARLGFRRLLGVQDKALTDDDFDGLDAEINARIALGLALAEEADGQVESARMAFRALRGPDVHASVRDWVDRWQVWALLQANHADEALSVAQGAIDRMAPPFTSAKAALCMLLVRGVTSPDLRDRMAILGLSGLVRIGRSDLARVQLDGRDLRAAAPPGALAHWLRGQVSLSAAEKGSGADGYSSALAAFTAALAAAPEPALGADCRFGQAWCHFRLGDAAQARDGFRQAISELKAQGLPAADAEWMALLCDWNLADVPAAERVERIAAQARAFRGAHPDHPGAGRADELVARLRRELTSPEDLAKDPPDDHKAKVAIARKQPDERASLIALAERAEEDFRAAKAAERPDKAAAALEAHRRLASALVDFPDRVRTNPTLRLIYVRMARYAIDAGKPEIALRHLSLLRAGKPDDPEVLRLTGLANSRAGQSSAALECWRELLARLPADSAGWFEAKYHQIEIITKTDRPRAKRIWEQFQFLHPDLGPGPWPDRFRALAAQLP